MGVFCYNYLMVSVFTKFALDFAPPDPGCVYKYKLDPAWGRIPDYQVCETSKSPYFIGSILIVVILVLVVLIFLIKKRKSTRK
jgi:hypothetical protein